MTVLTWRAGIIAADRRVTWGDDVQGPMCKLVLGQTDKYRFVVAASGSSESDEFAVTAAKQILSNGFRRPDVKGDFTLLIAAKPKNPRLQFRLIDFALHKGERKGDADDTSLVVYGGKNLPEYLARGSGSSFALGSMARGGSAIQSIQDTAKHCATVGDGVNWVDTSLPVEQWRMRQRKAKKSS